MNVDTNTARHFGVVHRCPHHGAGPSLLKNQPKNQRHGCRHRDDEDSINWKIKLTDLVGSGKKSGNWNRVRIPTPDDQRQVLKYQGESHGREHLTKLLPTQPLEKRVPFADTYEGDSQRAGEDRESEISSLPDDCERNVPSQQVVRAMRHVDDPHHPEDEGKSSREKKKERSVGDAVESLGYPEFHALFRFEKLKRWATFCYHPPPVLVNEKKVR